MSASHEDRDASRRDAAGHFAEAQSELLEGIRSLLRGGGGLGDAIAGVVGLGERREEALRRDVLERIRAVLVEERDALPEDDAATRRAFGAVVAVLDRELLATGTGGRPAKGAGRVREVPVE